MVALLIGYARVSTDQQDLTAQREGLEGLGVDPARIYVDHGLINPAPGVPNEPNEALAGRTFDGCVLPPRLAHDFRFRARQPVSLRNETVEGSTPSSSTNLDRPRSASGNLGRCRHL